MNLEPIGKFADCPHDVDSLERMNVVIVGHVDHGKSTVVGRLLADTNSLPDGKLESIKKYCDTNSKPFEYAFLIDALKDERSQGITIDAARVFFKSSLRRYIIIDAPGHVEFVKNMITGAARASAALLVVDAKEGMRENSRRHGYLLSMLGIKQVVVLVNKLDSVEYCQDRFNEVVSETNEFLASVRLNSSHFIPTSGFRGDNIASRSIRTSWYRGPTVLEALDQLNAPGSLEDQPFRLPVQGVYNFTSEKDSRRTIAGTVESGSITVGDEVVFYPSRKRSRIRSVEGFRTPVKETAKAGEATAFTLTDEIYVTRGEIAVREGEKKTLTGKLLEVNLFWLGKKPLRLNRKYKFKLGTVSVDASIEEIDEVLDAGSLERTQKMEVGTNEIAKCKVLLERQIAFDKADTLESTSRFVLVDDHRVSGGGLILSRLGRSDRQIADHVRSRDIQWIRGPISAQARAERYNQKAALLLITGHQNSGRKALAGELERKLFQEGKFVYWMGMGNVVHGLNMDMERNYQARSEHFRRLAELSHILLETGVLVIVTAVDVNAHELKMLKAVNPDRPIHTIWLGQNITTDLVPDLVMFPAKDCEGTISSKVSEIKDYLIAQKLIFDPG